MVLKMSLVRDVIKRIVMNVLNLLMEEILVIKFWIKNIKSGLSKTWLSSVLSVK
jgi:hypothetical protein